MELHHGERWGKECGNSIERAFIVRPDTAERPSSETEHLTGGITPFRAVKRDFIRMVFLRLVMNEGLR